jgi:hypothetical protein
MMIYLKRASILSAIGSFTRIMMMVVVSDGVIHFLGNYFETVSGSTSMVRIERFGREAFGAR